MSTATNGRAREHGVIRRLEALGWLKIMRAAGSKGPADLAMAHEEHGLALIQVGTASKSLGPADRARFLRAAYLCSALPLVAICRQGMAPKFFIVTAAPASRWEEWKP